MYICEILWNNFYKATEHRTGTAGLIGTQPERVSKNGLSLKMEKTGIKLNNVKDVTTKAKAAKFLRKSYMAI